MDELPVFIKCTKILQNIVIELNRDVMVKNVLTLETVIQRFLYLIVALK